MKDAPSFIDPNRSIWHLQNIDGSTGEPRSADPTPATSSLKSKKTHARSFYFPPEMALQ
jgi:hypothetical protein